MYRTITLLLAGSMLAYCGCSKAPKGFPKVVPCQITVVQGTKPLEQVDVTLLPSDPRDSTMFFGKTDTSGVCKVGTTFANYRKNGVPEGNYKVVLTKIPEIEQPKTEGEVHACCAHSMSRESHKYQAEVEKGLKKPQIIPDALTQSSSTPLTLAVSKPGATLAVNLEEYK